MAAVSVYTSQGRDAFGRGGRFARQIFLGPPEVLTLSLSTRLPDSWLLTRDELPLDGQFAAIDRGCGNLDVISPAEGAAPTEILKLLDRAHQGGWSEFAFPEARLEDAGAVLAILGSGWDAGAALDFRADTASGVAEYVVTLPRTVRPSTYRASFDHSAWRLGDARLNDLAVQFSRCESRQDLRRAYESWRQPTAGADHSALPTLSDALVQYRVGNSGPLRFWLEGHGPDASDSAAEAALKEFLGRGDRIGVLDDDDAVFVATQFTRAAGALAGAGERSTSVACVSFLESLRPMVHGRLTPALFDLIEVWFDASPPTVLKDPRVQLGEGLVAHFCERWRSHAAQRTRLSRVIAAFGPGAQGLACQLAEAANDEDQLEVLFADVFPDAFACIDLEQLVFNCRADFLRWINVAPAYAGLLDVKQPRGHWWSLRRTSR